MTAHSDHRPVETVETAINLLGVLKQAGRTGMGVTEVATELGLAKSTAHRHLQTLADRGLIVRAGDIYRLSSWFLDYGVHVRNQHPLYDLARPKVDELAAETDEKVWCVIEEDDTGVHLYGADGAHSVTTHARVGNRTPLHQFAAGKAILANLPEGQIARIIDGHGLSERTPQTITDPGELRTELDSIREEGYALNREESVPGVHAVGAPVRDEDGHAIGAISIAGPANRLRGELLTQELPDLLLGAVNEVEVNLAHI
ncbi:IclR family transcriptional regulator [Natrialba chahannaoensis JCM 10990]|uniref:IclR family transcriptional regulator n=1 Tax=Natrialba chahannaoensis JCM 10990 TaxID=1227492 RepID=M0B4D3_9EURY|nr:IclR family transcriptional regulator [Natrialba chahannaoensis]ELZ05680.1 IclR family transcriptional regulator [Natrialba chahannaoensis JCM 10990]